MKWDETIANECRYGYNARNIWGDSEIIWEYSEADYQGGASFLAIDPNGIFSFYEWSYGSCSGCDDWENRELSDEEIEIEMRSDAVYFDNISQVCKYFKIDLDPTCVIENYMEGLEVFNKLLDIKMDNRSEQIMHGLIEYFSKFN